MSDEGADEASRERAGGRGPRRYHSTYGAWFLPYVDDTKVVYVPTPRPAAFFYLTAGAVAQAALTALSLLLASGVWVSRPVMGVDFCCALFPFLLWITAVPLAVYVSRITPIRRRLVIERIATPDGGTIEAVVDGVPFPPTRARCLAQGTLFGGRRLWLGLGHRVFELWNVDVSPGGGRRATREVDWVEERLVSPQEGGPAEARNEGNGGMNLPVIDSLRTVLGIGPEQRIRLGWLPLPGRVGLTLLGVGAVMAAGSIATTRLLTRATVGLAPALVGAIGAATGAALVVAQLAVLRWYLRRTLAPALDRAADEVSDLARRSQSARSPSMGVEEASR